MKGMKEPEYEFSGYLLRPAGEDDLELARRWTEADPDHAGRVDPWFWLEQDPTRQGWVLEDAAGPVFFFKGILYEYKGCGDGVTRGMEVHVQFGPLPMEGSLDELRAARRRTMTALTKGLRWLETVLAGQREEIVFESRSPGLMRFCEKRLGFERDRKRGNEGTREQGMEILRKRIKGVVTSLQRPEKRTA